MAAADTESGKYKVLTPELRQHFLEHGWIKIENAVSPENIERFKKDIWIRLGYDPNNKETWEKEKVHTPRHRQEPMKDYSPKGYAAISELVGGEDRLDPGLFESAGDSLICNFGSKQWENAEPLNPRLLGNWHIDGDWFRHFLDSGDQAMTAIILYNDIEPSAGGTFLAEDGVRQVVNWLYDHPEGADEWPVDETGARVNCNIHQCNEFTELTGKTGDMILFHPFMPHSASKNYKRIPRFITNPTISLRAPFQLHRENPEEYSLLELKVLRELKALGKTDEEIANWKITRNRRRFTPRTRAGKDAMINAELERMRQYEQASNGAYKIDSMHRDGVKPYLVVTPTEG